MGQKISVPEKIHRAAKLNDIAELQVCGACGQQLCVPAAAFAVTRPTSSAASNTSCARVADWFCHVLVVWWLTTVSDADAYAGIMCRHAHEQVP